MRKNITSISAFVFFLLFLWSCNKEAKINTAQPSLPATTYDYIGKSKITRFVNPFVKGNVGIDTITVNPFSNLTITLGLVIFYNQTVVVTKTPISNCGNCHKSQFAFGDERFQGTIGLSNSTNQNNTPNPNNRVKSSGMWDGTSQNMDEAIRKHIESVGMPDIDQLVADMSRTPYYADLFSRAYGSPEITPAKVTNALSQFVLALSAQDASSDPHFADPFRK